MTEQEAETLVERLRRIWLPPVRSEARSTWMHTKHGIHFDVQLVESSIAKIEVRIAHVLLWTGTQPLSRLWFSIEGQMLTSNAGWLHGVLRLNPADSTIVVQEEFESAQYKQMYEEFVAQWTPFFRRGCWLSGCDIEASAHEKLEWMQGFSREEIEAWNLKI